MGMVVSLIMITVGAIMRFAVTAQGTGWNVHTTGVILMIVGAVGALISIVFWGSWGGLGRRKSVMGTQPTVVDVERVGEQGREVR